MSEPTVCAILLTRDRPELAAKAVECWRAQTYESHLLILNGGRSSVGRPENQTELMCHPDIGACKTIGALRNLAVSVATGYDIIVHLDDDDWSHPNRIAEQVALLQASGADVVGYNEMLFWRDVYPHQYAVGPSGKVETGGEAWLYTSPVPKPTLGTSLAYWRKTWELKPFNPKLPNNSESLGEDTEFIRGLKCAAVSALGQHIRPGNILLANQPRMIARIHGANSTKYNIEDARGSSWKRVPEWDNRVRGILG